MFLKKKRSKRKRINLGDGQSLDNSSRALGDRWSRAPTKDHPCTSSAQAASRGCPYSSLLWGAPQSYLVTLSPCPLRHPSCCHSCKGGPAPAAGDAGHQLEALLQISVFQQQVGLYRLTFVDPQRQSVAPSMSQWTAWQPLLHIVQDVFVLLHWSRWRASRCAMGENPEVSEKIKWADSITRTTEFVNVDIQSK